ncbi:thiamine phosphate synthase [Desulfogranum mediterraneum]|uniref:thiamine phosphate synthase n=1 Tax=Desulfogranum mediterraneum TaxID=160661 RepID=UPI000553E4FE|nr:thiamine phosphate synthase [Desulfogranum mediterraneum]
MKAESQAAVVDYSLYLVTDRELSLGRSLESVIGAAVQGGVSCVQLREKQCSTRDFVDQARRLNEILQPLAIPLIINDRVDVALAVGARGVHLGQQDMSLADAREILGREMIIGISAESLEDAITAQRQGADYIGISPVFATSTKADTAPPLGLAGLRAIREQVELPLVGIGGINADNAKAVMGAGADGVAVVSAIVGAACPRDAAITLRRQLWQG